MTMFGEVGQDAINSLSDEALFAEEERQEEDTPQTETANIEETEEASPANEQTSENGGEEAVPEKGQTEYSAEEYARMKRQYDEMWKWNSRVSARNKELERQLAALQQTKTTPTLAQKSDGTNVDSRDKIRQLVDDPAAFIAPLLDEKLRPIIEERDRALAQRQEQENKEKFNTAFADCASAWSQLADGNNRKEMVRKMIEIGMTQEGDEDAWQRDPDRYIFAACKALWGIPRVNNPEAIEAAKKAEREAVISEYNDKKKRENLSVVQNANKEVTGKETPEVDPILAEMRAFSSEKNIF